MVVRKILDESDFKLMRYQHPDCIRRRLILKETLNTFSTVVPADYYSHQVSMSNLYEVNFRIFNHNI